MRINIDIDDQLLEEAFAISKAKTKKELIHEALTKLIQLHNRKDMTELAGLIEFDADFGHKKLRELRT